MHPRCVENARIVAKRNTGHSQPHMTFGTREARILHKRGLVPTHTEVWREKI